MCTSGFRSWEAYRKGFLLARKVYLVTANFPPVERSMIDQMRRSSRSVRANVAEAFGVRKNPKFFRSKIAISISENFETQVWLDFALDTKYINRTQYEELCLLSAEVGKLLSHMDTHPEKFAKWRVR